MVVHNFIVEDGEVKSKTKSNWVACVQRFGGGLSKSVVFKGTILDGIKLITLSALGNVSVVVTHHLVEEGFGLVSGGNFHALGLDDLNNGDTLVVKFLFDFLLVASKSLVELGVFWVLLDGANGSNSCSLGANLVLETNRQKVSFFSGEVFVLALNNFLEVLDHVVKSLGLLGNSSHKNIFFQTHFSVF
jgi:hypothetical protein